MKPTFLAFVLLSIAVPATAQPRTSETDDRLASALARFPEADTDKDGVLTADEARAFVAKRRERQEAQKGEANPTTQPTHADISYGDHERHAFDLWLAKSEGRPTPLVVFIHGGGFQAGDKSRIDKSALRFFLSKGISVGSLNYRLTDGGKHPYPAPMHDAARAIQTIRHRAAEWNIDKEKIAAWGGSAGAGISLWLAFHEDRANPKANDPVARESTRLVAAGTSGGQSTYDTRVFRKWFGVPDLPWHTAIPSFYGLMEGEDQDTPRIVALAEDASPINHLTADDPPVFQVYSRPNEPVTRDTSQSVWVHHPLLGLKLQEKMRELEIECVVIAPGIEDETYEDLPDFLAKKVLMKP